MANSLISMIKGDSTLINNTEVLDGQVLFNTDEKTILLDDDNTRTKYCGADKSNKNLAPIENGNTATRGYAAGSYVVWKEQLYKVLTQINSGTAFVVGTNIALDTVGAELTQINNDLNRGSVSVTGNGVKTLSTLLNELFATADVTKITRDSVLADGAFNARLVRNGTTYIEYGYVGRLCQLNAYVVEANGSTAFKVDFSTNTLERTERSSEVVTNGKVITLYY